MKKLLILFLFLASITAYGQSGSKVVIKVHTPGSTGIAFDSTYIYLLANSKVPLIRTLTINGVTQDMTTNMNFTVSPTPTDTSNKWIQTLAKNVAGDSFIFYKGNIRYALPDRGGTVITSGGVDSITFINNTIIQWIGGVSTSFRLNKFYDSTHLNFDSTRYIHYNGGTIVDSVTIPTDYVVAGINMTITDSTGSGKNYKVFNSTGGGGGSVTTSEQEQTASGTGALTFTSVPATYSDYILFRNGVLQESVTDFTTSGNVITGTWVSGDRIVLRRTK